MPSSPAPEDILQVNLSSLVVEWGVTGIASSPGHCAGNLLATADPFHPSLAHGRAQEFPLPSAFQPGGANGEPQQGVRGQEEGQWGSHPPTASRQAPGLALEMVLSYSCAALGSSHRGPLIPLDLEALGFSHMTTLEYPIHLCPRLHKWTLYDTVLDECVLSSLLGL